MRPVSTHVTASAPPNWALGGTTQAGPTGQEAAERNGAMCVNKGRGQVLLAGVDIERKCEESRAGGHSRVVGGGVWEEACQRSE